MKFAVAVSFVVIAATSARAQQPATSPSADSAAIVATILQLEQKYNKALAASDTVVLDSLVAPDAWIIRPNGEQHQKAEWLHSFAEKFHMDKAEARSTKVHVHGGDGAVVVTEMATAGTSHLGTRLAPAHTVGTIWVNRGGKWQIVLRTSTSVR